MGDGRGLRPGLAPDGALAPTHPRRLDAEYDDFGKRETEFTCQSERVGNSDYSQKRIKELTGKQE